MNLKQFIYSLDKLISQIDKGFQNISEEDLKQLPVLVIDLLAKILRTDPQTRLKPSEALEHEWLKSFEPAQEKQEEKKMDN